MMFVSVIGSNGIALCSAAYSGTITVTMNVSNGPVPIDKFPIYEDRWNPRMWAQWFREFLAEHLPKRREVVAAVSTSRAVRGACARSQTLRQREWKMKLWKQAL